MDASLNISNVSNIPKRGEKKSQLVDHANCLICGDKATGFNFNGWSCESCKAFFRRNALKKKVWKCPFNNSCHLTKVTRRFCQKCRIKKCYAIGMRNELIMTESEKTIRKQIRSEANRSLNPVPSTSGLATHSLVDPVPADFAITIYSDASDADDDEDTIDIDQLIPNPVPQSTNKIQIETDVIILDDNQPSTSSQSSPCKLSMPILSQDPIPAAKSSPNPVQNFYNFHGHYQAAVDEVYRIESAMRTGFTPNSVQRPSLNPLRAGRPLRSAVDSELDEQLRAVRKSAYRRIAEAEFADIDLQSGNSDSNQKELNRTERAKLDELTVSFNSVRDFVKRIPPPFWIKSPSLMELVKMMGKAIGKLITVIKKLDSFKELCETDQRILLKSSCAEMMTLQAIAISGAIKGSIKRDNGLLMSHARLNDDQDVINFLTGFTNCDESALLLLTAISLFNPDLIGLEHPEAVRMQQFSYMFLLKRHMETHCESICESRTKYVELVASLDEMARLRKNIVELLQNLDPLVVEPLLNQIFCVT